MTDHHRQGRPLHRQWSEAECKDAALLSGLTEEEGTLYYLRYESRGWKDGTGQPITNISTHMRLLKMTGGLPKLDHGNNSGQERPKLRLMPIRDKVCAQKRGLTQEESRQRADLAQRRDRLHKSKPKHIEAQIDRQDGIERLTKQISKLNALESKLCGMPAVWMSPGTYPQPYCKEHIPEPEKEKMREQGYDV